MKSDPNKCSPRRFLQCLGGLLRSFHSQPLKTGYVWGMGCVSAVFPGFWSPTRFQHLFWSFLMAVSLSRKFRDLRTSFFDLWQSKSIKITRNCDRSIPLLEEIIKTPKNSFRIHRSSEIRSFKVAKMSNQIWFLAPEILVRSVHARATLIARFSGTTQPFSMIRLAFWRGACILRNYTWLRVVCLGCLRDISLNQTTIL